MSTQQWHRTLNFMALFLGLAWFALGFTPIQSMATNGITDYFPPPTQLEIEAVLKNVRRDKSMPPQTPARL